MKCNEIVPTFMIFKGFFDINNNTQKNANTVRMLNLVVSFLSFSVCPTFYNVVIMLS